LRLRVLAAAGLSAVLLTACGGESSGDSAERSSPTRSAATGPQIAAAAGEALQQAGSVRLRGDLTGEGRHVVLDLGLVGPDIAGTVTLDDLQLGLTVVEGIGYIQAPPAYWLTQGVSEPLASRLAASWVRPPGDAASGLAPYNLDRLVALLGYPNNLTYEDEAFAATLDGRSVWLVTDSDGSTTRIAAEGPPYPIQIRITGAPGGVLTLSDFGAVPPITGPADAVDLSDVGA
jgi:hypothetical protein